MKYFKILLHYVELHGKKYGSNISNENEIVSKPFDRGIKKSCNILKNNFPIIQKKRKKKVDRSKSRKVKYLLSSEILFPFSSCTYYTFDIHANS